MEHCKPIFSKSDKITAKILIATILILSVWVALSPTDRERIKPADNPWHEEVHLGISQALVAKGITGCGVYRWRNSPSGATSEYEVDCSRDGVTWKPYLVWPHIKEVSPR